MEGAGFQVEEGGFQVEGGGEGMGWSEIEVFQVERDRKYKLARMAS